MENAKILKFNLVKGEAVPLAATLIVGYARDSGRKPEHLTIELNSTEDISTLMDITNVRRWTDMSQRRIRIHHEGAEADAVYELMENKCMPITSSGPAEDK